MKTFSITIATIAMLVGVSCSESETPVTTAQNAPVEAQRLMQTSAPDVQGSHKVYYNNKVFKIELMKNDHASPTSLAARGESVSKMFYTVKFPSKLLLDRVTKDLTQNAVLYLVEFDGRSEPYQFTTMEELNAAQAKGEITITSTDELYLFALR